MPPAMAEVMLKVVTLGIERVVVLDFPSRTTCRGKFSDIVIRNAMGRGPRVAEQHVTVGIPFLAPWLWHRLV